jgi:hypothetical protein
VNKHRNLRQDLFTFILTLAFPLAFSIAAFEKTALALEIVDEENVQSTDIGMDGSFGALTAGSPGAGFSRYYHASGQPKFSYTDKITKRFPDHLNKGSDFAHMPTGDQVKWQKIYQEIVRIANRTVEVPKSLLVVDKKAALACSIGYEKTGSICATGAWTIAVQETAVRHGFASTPCAEFMSEVIREAYTRAGYRVTDDFSASRGNPLIWSSSAAVINLSAYLDKAGWIPWDSIKYRPIVGAVLMNGRGQTPGHTYMSAGNDGRFIIDNGAPQGRDLETTSEKNIGMMYQTGLFFLPPGINPPTWTTR